MSYNSLSALQADTNFLRRCAGCFAEQQQAGQIPWDYDPWEWIVLNSWALAATPGFATSYGYALETGVPNPGIDESVISDAQILAAVQALWGEISNALPEA